MVLINAKYVINIIHAEKNIFHEYFEMLFTRIVKKNSVVQLK